jgi:nicotinamide mononucleotide transporter
MGFVGLYHWARPGNKEVSLTISTITGKAHLGILILGLMLSIPVGYFLRLYSNAAFSYMDSITTVFSIIATVLLIQKKLENWIYWIVIDVVNCYLFFQREGYLISLLYGIYLIVAVYGYRQWSAKMKY